MTVKNDTASTVSVDEIISSAQINLGLNSDDDRIYMLEWVSEANRAIGLGIHNEMQEIIDINDFTFPAPCGMISATQIRLISSSSTSGQRFISPFYDNSAFLRKTGDNRSLRGAVTIQLQGNLFVLSNNISSDTFSQAEIKYYGVPLDENDYPLIEEYNKRAIVQYIEYMYIKRQRRRKRGMADSVPQSEVREEYDKYVRLKAEAISKKKQPSKMRMNTINREWNTLLPNQRKSTSRPDSGGISGGFFFLT